MADKKHIDKLFQDRLRDLEQQPHDDNWEAIKARLQKKKRKRPFIIWWKAAGVAALVAVIIGLGIIGQRSTISDPTNADLINFDHQPEEMQHIPVSKKVKNALAIDLDRLNENLVDNNAVSTDKVSASREIAKERNGTNHEKVFRSTENFVNSFDPSIGNIGTESFLGVFDLKGKNTYDLIPNELKTPPEINLTGFLNAGLAEKNDDEDDINETEQVAQNDQKDDLTNDDDKERKKENKSKWSINPEISPVFAGSFSGNNGLGADLASNGTTSNISLTYGINMGYELSSRLKIISGVKQLNSSSTTRNVLAANTNMGQDLASSNIDQNNSNILVTSPSTFQELSSQVEGLGRTPTQNGSLEQQLNFIEVPIGLAYKLVDRKVGVEVNAGVSSLFLAENELFLRSDGSSERIGSLSNVNATSFMTNIGLGLDYDLSNELDFNLRPTFKYQLNTFDSSTTDLQPYIIAIYTGFTYSF